ncbi:FxDxF family PEP-CTERM protein [Janthinobacterium psychrotolerans]|uniref:PEP-CTERM protein-sorting domain-containing protein n=1 Tax=Janthinobacterium psychrotolerans TaxID=1747903 RepID=A0A1A7C8K0_9BURK|nr:FxDxF family PEP-CTERM protein [Janthinobacterium psychrotolerans]OBV40648.1 PEP-CTERM protein-sorting domain-containing protein [Janthinobacterium psychrotolerans]
MKLKLKLIVAGVLTAASFSAVADHYALGSLDPLGADTASKASAKFIDSGTAITDSWFFQLLTPSSSSFGALQTFSVAEGAITDFAGSLVGVDSGISYGALSATPGSSSQSLSWAAPLAAGNYRVDITGTTAIARSQYVATVAALPVPEPATCAMMLAGLALVGAVARRRGNRPA